MTSLTTTKLRYALFPNTQVAHDAAERIDGRVDGNVEVLTRPEDLSQDKIPIGHTMARVGAILGASMVAGAVLLTLAALVVLGADVLPMRVTSPYATTAIVVMLAALFGGLAGALSYSTRARDELRRLRTLLRFGNSVVLVESDDDVSQLMRRAGAVQTGTLA